MIIRFAMCLDGDNQAYTQIRHRAMRAIDPDAGRNPRDKQYRAKLRKTLIGKLRPVEEIKSQGILPAFAINFATGSRVAIPIEKADIETIAKKWCRGLYKYHFDRLVPVTAAIDVYFVEDQAAQKAYAELFQHAEFLHRGPDLLVMAVHAAENEIEMTLFAFQLWQEFKVHCAVTVKTLAEGK